MSDVPEEIWREILSRLPVAPLLRLRCVSKSWKSLIDSHEFIKHHLDHSRKTNTKLSIIILSGFDLCSADFDLLNQTNRTTFQEVPHPLKESFVGGIQILGSCDGLLALKNDYGDDVIIWNPSVKRFHEVPYTSIEFSGSVVLDVNIFYGFGYDVVNNDYKIVRMVWYYGDPKGTIGTEAKVYSLKSNSWRRVPDFPRCGKYITANGEFVNGALHWIVTRKVKPDTPGTERFVAAFDLGTEEYRLMPLPKLASDDDIYVIVLGGCLSLMCYVNGDHVDLWVMKEYGVQESWSILFGYDICHSAMNFTKPLAYSKCGRKVLLGLRLNDEVLMWYDLDKKSTDVPMVQMPLIHVFDMFTCLQSLVLLNNGACDFDLVANK